jgi:hypothetical protein
MGVLSIVLTRKKISDKELRNEAYSIQQEAREIRIHRKRFEVAMNSGISWPLII